MSNHRRTDGRMEQWNKPRWKCNLLDEVSNIIHSVSFVNLATLDQLIITNTYVIAI